MCWSMGATVAMVAVGSAATVATIHRKEPPAVPATIAYFTLMEVLHGYTAGGAWAAKLEDLTGTLRIGLAGDLVLLDGDIEATPFAHIGEMGIALTVAGGRITHQGAGIA